MGKINSDYDVKRWVWNMEVWNRVRTKIDQHPEWRIEQLLWNLGLCGDHFYEEPWDTAARLDALNQEAYIKSKEIDE